MLLPARRYARAHQAGSLSLYTAPRGVRPSSPPAPAAEGMTTYSHTHACGDKHNTFSLLACASFEMSTPLASQIRLHTRLAIGRAHPTAQNAGVPLRTHTECMHTSDHHTHIIPVPPTCTLGGCCPAGSHAAMMPCTSRSLSAEE